MLVISTNRVWDFTKDHQHDYVNATIVNELPSRLKQITTIQAERAHNLHIPFPLPSQKHNYIFHRIFLDQKNAISSTGGSMKIENITNSKCYTSDLRSSFNSELIYSILSQNFSKESILPRKTPSESFVNFKW